MYKRSAIALMITMFFIMLITIAIGISLKQVNETKKDVESENFMLQTNYILDDISKVLKSMPELKEIADSNSSESLNILLLSASIIPIESNGVSILIELSSARSKFNINNLVDINSTLNQDRLASLSVYVNSFGINPQYINFLVDNMSKIKQDMSYNTDIFNEESYLFRDYISSYKHLEHINKYYIKSYNENSLTKINFEELFYFSKDKENTKIDLNQATQKTWQLMLSCDELRAEQLVSEAGSYEKLQDFLDDEEKALVGKFATSFFEPILDVKIEIMQKEKTSKMSFEYNMKTGKGSNFVYEI